MAYPTEDEIRSLCTAQSFERGRNYYQQNRIQQLDIDGNEISATVRGSHRYNVLVDISDDRIRTRCSCPYDYAGDCKHIVAVLLAVDDRDSDGLAGGSDSRTDSPASASVDIDTLLEQTDADELRAFLRTVLEDDPDVRDRFVAFTGGGTKKTVFDYKQEINRRFERATNRRGLVEYDTWIDFSQYRELADTHREQGDIETAVDIYRALAEAICENLDRVDDSSGHYGQAAERAIESAAETLAEANLSHDEKRPYIESFVEAVCGTDYEFASGSYDDALRMLCTTDADHEHWLECLNEQVDGIDLLPAALDAGMDRRADQKRTDRTAADRERTDDVLYASDFTHGPLRIEEFTGGTVAVDHLAVGPLELSYFVGDAFEELRVDETTTVETHTVTLSQTTAGTGATDGEQFSSLRTRRILSTACYLLDELGETEALLACYEQIYLESSRFCKQYAERLADRGDEQHAISVLEDGINTHDSSDLRWRAAELYENRDPQQYRTMLKQLFTNHSKWAAYDELKDTCDEHEWQSIYEAFEQHCSDDRRQLIRLYIHEGDLEAAFSEITARDELSLFKRYREPVARVDPVEYFEQYRERLVPFAAGDTGRRHYREIVDHLDELQKLVPDERFESFIDGLSDEHANRPAFLDELERAGY